MPDSSVRSSGTVTTGKKLVSTTTFGLDMSSEFSSLDSLVTTPNAITVARIANAISAGRQRSKTDSLTGIFIVFYFVTNLLRSVSLRLA